MANNTLHIDDVICPECGKQVEILDGYVQFSLELHSQSHNPLETINYKVDDMKKMKTQQSIKMVNYNYVSCPECTKNIKVFNNNVILAINQHTLKHESGNSPKYCQGEAQTTRRRQKKKVKDSKPKMHSEPNSLLRDIFNSMPTELKAHRGFISLCKNGTVFCSICEITIEATTSVNEHLKSKFHEDHFKRSLTKTTVPMANNTLHIDDVICPECGKQVEILNDDVQFSLELHSQSHKSLETINYKIDDMKKMKIQQFPKMVNYNYVSSPKFTGNIEISNNVSLAHHHTLKNEPGNLPEYSQGESQESIGRKKTQKNLKDKKTKMHSEPISLLQDIFNSMPTELKAHLGFISPSTNYTVLCSICEVTIEPITSINEHLKTKFHEDRSIKYFKDILSNEMYHIIEFVSFNDSRICCNLCRYNLDMFSDNPYNTIYYIMMHNLSKEHMEKKTMNCSDYGTAKASAILKSFSQVNQLISDNHHFVDFQIQIEIRCKLCNVVLGSCLDEILLYQSLNTHFISKDHLNAKVASELQEYAASNIVGKETHHFITLKGSIYCSVCECFIEPNATELIHHVTRLPYDEMSRVQIQQGRLFSALSKTNSSTEHSTQRSEESSSVCRTESEDNRSERLKSIHRTLREEINISFLVETNKNELMCLICNCRLP